LQKQELLELENPKNTVY